MKISDSHWHKQISAMAKEGDSTHGVYWTWPFENYKTFCPYLVGSYQEVCEEICRYLLIGYRTFILDIPPNREELRHVQAVFQMASELALP
jgi:alkanesulfonate monooxygenase